MTVQTARSARAAGFRTIIALLTITGLAMIALVAPQNAPKAWAATSKFTVSNISVTKTKGSPAGDIQVGGIVSIAFDWKANEKLAAGDSFSIELPDTLATIPTSRALRGSNGRQVGECVGQAHNLTCTVNAEATRGDSASGKVSFPAEAMAPSAASVSAAVTSGGQTADVAVRLESSVIKEPFSYYRPTAFEKEGRIGSNGHITWYTQIPYTALEGKESITITHSVTSDNHEFVNFGRGFYFMHILWDNDYELYEQMQRKMHFEITNGGKGMRVTIRKPSQGWPEGQALRVMYKSKPTNGLPAGSPFSSEAQLGTGEKASATVTLSDDAPANAQNDTFDRRYEINTGDSSATGSSDTASTGRTALIVTGVIGSLIGLVLFIASQLNNPGLGAR